jgi:anthranilate synthase/aminodeoxychorismate synthase-like glutamine amidotransferase
MIIVIDNYDSFVYNLAQYLGELGQEPMVFRNDRIGIDDITRLQPTHLVISPGPRTPFDAGISNDVIRQFGGRIPILGVCLGHQCIGHVYGGTVGHAPVPTHGKSSPVFHDGRRIFRGLPVPFPGGRYHSLAVVRESVPPALEISAWTEDGLVMGVRHRQFAVEGVQFHPESIMTPVGHDLVRNFLQCKAPIWPEAE